MSVTKYLVYMFETVKEYTYFKSLIKTKLSEKMEELLKCLMAHPHCMQESQSIKHLARNMFTLHFPTQEGVCICDSKDSSVHQMISCAISSWIEVKGKEETSISSFFNF